MTVDQEIEQLEKKIDDLESEEKRITNALIPLYHQLEELERNKEHQKPFYKRKDTWIAIIVSLIILLCMLLMPHEIIPL